MKNKKSLIALVALLIVGVVGSTFAYFTTTQKFTNEFATEQFKTVVTESFESPDDWTPGTTTNKVVTAKNEGDVEVAVRVKLEQKWVAANKTDLGLKATAADGKEFDVAVINFTNAEKWELKDGYYYYKEVLGNGESTLPLFESVTYNANLTDELAGIVCDTVTDDAAHTVTQTCTSGNGYAGATYTLDVTVETIQADASDDVWGYTAQ